MANPPEGKEKTACAQVENGRTELSRRASKPRVELRLCIRPDSGLTQLKFMPVLDEHTRESLALEVERSMRGHDVVDVLAYLFQAHGEPEFVRSVNGPEFVSKAVKKGPAESGVKTLFIEPGRPWENAHIESFDSRLRVEFLNRRISGTVTEAQVLAEQHRVYHKLDRPHSSLDFLTPAEFAALDGPRFYSPRCGEASSCGVIREQVFRPS